MIFGVRCLTVETVSFRTFSLENGIENDSPISCKKSQNMKRIFDFVVALLGLSVIAVIGPVLAVLIKFDSPGPAIFAQTRVGRNGKPFKCYKFRTMYVDTGDVPTHEVPQAAITRIGRLLRASKVDEVPQLYNVVAGEMSLVGPRPCLPSQSALIAARRAAGVIDWRPGITGLAQVRGIDMSDPHRLAQVDAEYVKNQTMGLDLRILCATVIGRLLSPV